MSINVTVCELPDDRNEFAVAWAKLQHHVETESTDLLILNEAPFANWFAFTDTFDEVVWNAAVASHDSAIAELSLPGSTIGTALINLDGRRHNRAFTWTSDGGAQPWRRKAYLPEEEPTFEATWYHPAPDQPDVRTVAGASVGVLTCTEIWKIEWTAQLGKMGAQVIATPRATGEESLDKWRAAGRVAAICSGAYSVSSNRVGNSFGGGGWIFSPDGELLASTNSDQPFVTVALDLELADESKGTYPRYALWAND